MRKNGKRIIALCVVLAFVLGTLWGTGVLPKYGIFSDVKDGTEFLASVENEMIPQDVSSNEEDPSEKFGMPNQADEENILEETQGEPEMLEEGMPASSGTELSANDEPTVDKTDVGDENIDGNNGNDNTENPSDGGQTVRKPSLT